MQHIFFTTFCYNNKEDMKMTENKEEIIIKHYTESIHYELEQTSKLMKMLGKQLFEKLEICITMDEYAALDTISINAGICQRDLAKLIIKDRANTGRILDTLEEKGFITRFIDTKNNRLVKKMGITEKGYEELNFINNKIKKHFESVTKKVPRENFEKAQKALKAFRLELEEMVETNI